MRQVHYAKTIAKDGRIMTYLKQSVNEIPEVMFAAAGMGATAIVTIICFSFTDLNKVFNHKYKMKPLYMRTDDPRVPLVHKP